MRSIPIIAALVGAGLLLAACSDSKDDRQNRYGSGSSYVPNYTPPPPPPPMMEPTPDASSFVPPEPTATPAPEVVKKDHQYGSPVPGKPGFVTSPHAPYAGYVDVREFPPGMEVKCPYTGKIFLVP